LLDSLLQELIFQTMSGLRTELLALGWHLSEEWLGTLKSSNVKDIIKQAQDIDLKEIGAPCIPDDINRGKVESISGPMVLMVTKIRNIGAPKVKEESNVAPRMLKVSLTDGKMTCHAVEIEQCGQINLQTLPGTKVRLKSQNIPVTNGFIRMTKSTFEVIGGHVEALVEKWKISQSLAEFTRPGLASGCTVAGGEGPPRWIPFGQKASMPKANPGDKNFKALETKDDSEEKENVEFASQRLEAIQEASKGEQKKFGGGTKQIVDSRVKREQERERVWREKK